MKKWSVELTKEARKELSAALKEELLSQEDVEILIKWCDEIEMFGPENIVNSRFWNDHPLDGNWRGYRSSSFGHKGRIIYHVLDEKILVEVVKVTTDHDYRR